ncbi:O-methyltransferase [Pseudaestuariivita rosea]|uniref:O-methyltransferase n=1 Tax=Pseudaestuariivita rosea TaxID=2763263 RepID=UPI001ABAFD26|nr:class I SAM-dependent methyltransferase [Pseudaestuariivita rosea]
MLFQRFEELYDEETCGWHIPKQWPTRFEPHMVQEWRKKYPPMTSPVEREVGQLYAALVAMERPSRVIETGTNFGYSGLAIGHALYKLGGDRHLYTVDVWGCAHLFKGSEAAPYITFLKGSSFDVELPEERFDMAFLDSDHSYKTIIKELNRFAPIIANDGLIVMHDTRHFDGVGLAVKQLMECDAFEVVNIKSPRKTGENERCPGVSIARKIKDVSPGFLEEKSEYFDVVQSLPGRTLNSPPLLL